jgi:hypothetical protein
MSSGGNLALEIVSPRERGAQQEPNVHKSPPSSTSIVNQDKERVNTRGERTDDLQPGDSRRLES